MIQEFTKKDRMVDLIHANYSLMPVIHRFGLRLGFRNKTVEELCGEFEINTDFFVAIVNTFHNERFFPEEKLLSFSPLLLIDYLHKTHEYYKNYSLPKIEKLLHQLHAGLEAPGTEMKMIEEFYITYKTKLLKHIDEEEKKVFPYVRELVKNPSVGKNRNLNLNFEKEHENVDFELDDLKNLILKYINPEYNKLVCDELLTEIFRFEKDIHDHARIEDAILIPQVQRLQKHE